MRPGLSLEQLLCGGHSLDEGQVTLPAALMVSCTGEGGRGTRGPVRVHTVRPGRGRGGCGCSRAGGEAGSPAADILRAKP